MTKEQIDSIRTHAKEVHERGKEHDFVGLNSIWLKVINDLCDQVEAVGFSEGKSNPLAMVNVCIEYLGSGVTDNHANYIRLSIIENGKQIDCRMSDKVMKRIITTMQDGDEIGYEFNYTDPISITSIWK